MSRITTLAMLTALPVSVLSIATFAQNGKPTVDARPSIFRHMLAKMDTNGDGRISLDEYLTAATTSFKRIDTQSQGSVDATQLAKSPAATERILHRAKALVNHLDKAGNGYVTPDEFRVAATKRFARLDQNGDGRLTRGELGKRFDKLDANHDGVVTQDEFLAAAAAMYHGFDTLANGRVTAKEIASSPMAAERAAHIASHLVKQMDSNGDGIVSQEEFLASARKRFILLDKNGDGFIDAGEWPMPHWVHDAKPTPSDG